MVTVIKKGSTKETIMEILKKLHIHKGLDAFKYCGIIRFKEDALIIQKKMRDEWK